MDRKKIILVVNKYCPLHPKAGGAEKNLLEIFSRIGETHRVVLLAALFPGAKKEEIYRNIHIYRIGSASSENIVRIHLLLPFALRAYLKNMVPDVLFEDVSVIPFFTPLFYPRQKKIVMVHGLNGRHFFASQRFFYALIGYIAEWLFLLLYRKENVIVVSEWMKEKLMKHGFTHISKILNGVDSIYFSIQKKYSPFPSVLFLGRLEGRKGIDLFLKTYSLVKKQIPNVRYLVAGKRFYFGEPRYIKNEIERAHSLSHEREINFFGHVSEKQKQELLSEAWICVVPSRTEGYGIAGIEANATGTFVIANDTVGLRESVINNKTGILTNCQNPLFFSEKIIEWLDTERLLPHEEKCRAWAKEHSWQKSFQSMESLLHLYNL